MTSRMSDESLSIPFAPQAFLGKIVRVEPRHDKHQYGARARDKHDVDSRNDGTPPSGAMLRSGG